MQTHHSYWLKAKVPVLQIRYIHAPSKHTHVILKHVTCSMLWQVLSYKVLMHINIDPTRSSKNSKDGNIPLHCAAFRNLSWTLVSSFIYLPIESGCGFKFLILLMWNTINDCM